MYKGYENPPAHSSEKSGSRFDAAPIDDVLAAELMKITVSDQSKEELAALKLELIPLLNKVTSGPITPATIKIETRLKSLLHEIDQIYESASNYSISQAQNTARVPNNPDSYYNQIATPSFKGEAQGVIEKHSLLEKAEEQIAEIDTEMKDLQVQLAELQVKAMSDPAYRRPQADVRNRLAILTERKNTIIAQFNRKPEIKTDLGSGETDRSSLLGS
jgi:hypothetical protein